MQFEGPLYPKKFGEVKVLPTSTTKKMNWQMPVVYFPHFQLPAHLQVPHQFIDLNAWPKYKPPVYTGPTPSPKLQKWPKLLTLKPMKDETGVKHVKNLYNELGSYKWDYKPMQFFKKPMNMDLAKMGRGVDKMFHVQDQLTKLHKIPRGVKQDMEHMVPSFPVTGGPVYTAATGGQPPSDYNPQQGFGSPNEGLPTAVDRDAARQLYEEPVEYYVGAGGQASHYQDAAIPGGLRG
eukprot:Platyproteum_vivax@DN3821_c0_g1_i1.p1